MSTAPQRPAPPGAPEGHEPVFREPWEAQAFALTLELHRAGNFTWAEWTERLAAEIAAAPAAGDPDLGDTYYHHWLAALERLIAEKNLLTPAQVARRKHAWARAYHTTPHGQPVKLATAE